MATQAKPVQAVRDGLQKSLTRARATLARQQKLVEESKKEIEALETAIASL